MLASAFYLPIRAIPPTNFWTCTILMLFCCCLLFWLIFVVCQPFFIGEFHQPGLIVCSTCLSFVKQKLIT